MRDRPLLKRRLVSAVLGSLREIRAPGWALSEAYQMYMTRFNDDAVSWVPELDYYIRLVQRIVESKTNKVFISHKVFNKINNLQVISEWQKATYYFNNCVC